MYVSLCVCMHVHVYKSFIKHLISLGAAAELLKLQHLALVDDFLRLAVQLGAQFAYLLLVLAQQPSLVQVLVCVCVCARACV